MKQASIAEILRQLNGLDRPRKILVLRGHIASQKKHSFMRAQLEAMLKPIVNQQLRKEVRDERKAS